METNDKSLKKYELEIERKEEELKHLKQLVLSQEIKSKNDYLDQFEFLNNNILKIESEIESLQLRELQLAPNDKEILLEVSKEQAQQVAIRTSRALDNQIAINKKLAKEITELEEKIKSSIEVNKHLDRLIENESEVNEYALLQNNYDRCGNLFKELREELNWYMSTRFSMDSPNDIGVNDALEMLTKRFIQDPNDPYLEMKDDIDTEVINYLISNNLIIRHPTNPFEFKIADFRLN